MSTAEDFPIFTDATLADRWDIGVEKVREIARNGLTVRQDDGTLRKVYLRAISLASPGRPSATRGRKGYRFRLDDVIDFEARAATLGPSVEARTAEAYRAARKASRSPRAAPEPGLDQWGWDGIDRLGRRRSK